MQFENHKTAVTRLATLAAIIALALGIVCIWTGAARASDADPQIYKMEATVDAPVIGKAPDERFTFAYFDQAGTQIDSDERASTWRAINESGEELFDKFEADKKYRFVAELSFLASDCPGVADSAQGYVNGKFNKQSPSVAHQQPNLHMIQVPYEWTLHQVTFHSNTASDTRSAQTVYEGEECKLAKNTFANEGFLFKEWNTKADGSGTAYADEALVNLDASIELYAQWRPEKATLTFDPAGGTYKGSTDTFEITAKIGETITIPDAPTRDGYSFSCWKGSEYQPGDTYTVEDDHAFIAEWVKNDGKKMFRLYNPNSGEHFYTSSTEEWKSVVSAGWLSEGVGWVAPDKSSKPVYRLYNANGGEHHYTMSVAERDALIACGWNDEGVGWYSDEAETVPIYREYNPNAFANNHNYTNDADEHAMLVEIGWNDEGIAWYGE